MSETYLEVTYRHGKPFAAYLYLNRQPGDKAARTQSHGSYIMDFAADGRAIGIEITDIDSVNLASINQVLSSAHQPALSQADLMPLEAA
ncbi:MAG TPA: hypothetical protein VGG19_07675 [Tepidisphaeraceae bacterium]|jgi:hypothetical protein